MHTILSWQIHRIRQMFLTHACKRRPIGPGNENNENDEKWRWKRKQRGGRKGKLNSFWIVLMGSFWILRGIWVRIQSQWTPYLRWFPYAPLSLCYISPPLLTRHPPPLLFLVTCNKVEGGNHVKFMPLGNVGLPPQWSRAVFSPYSEVDVPYLYPYPLGTNYWGPFHWVNI